MQTIKIANRDVAAAANQHLTDVVTGVDTKGEIPVLTTPVTVVTTPEDLALLTATLNATTAVVNATNAHRG
ncbi:hypothetical protein HQO44_17815 [Rhodococcus fascians]|nr:hypothetical protein [Rhodococcus fascians]